MNNKMKNYASPELEVTVLLKNDVITSSPGTETPKYDDDDGIWEYNIPNT